MPSRNTVVNSILDLVGATPLVRLRKVVPEGAAAVWAKLENLNPGGSIKERICLKMIEDAERAGLIHPSRNIIVEPTSGNTGIGLALVCSVKGYKLILTMPDDMSLERRLLLKAYGAELALTPADEKMQGAVRRAEQIASENKSAYMPQQFKNPSNPETHRLTTGPEILEQIEGNIDAFVAGVGTGGTISGVGEVLKRRFPDIHIVAVEPAESAVLSGGRAGVHDIQGIGAGFIPDTLSNVYNEIMQITGREARAFTKLIARQEGLLIGISAGAAALAAVRVAERLGRGKQVLTIFCDTGERYLSTGVFGESPCGAS
ncbi:MAG: cysteine synthase A [Deltaproteobacteria bacterium]